MLMQLFYGLLFHLITSSLHDVQSHYIEFHICPCLLLHVCLCKVAEKCKKFTLLVEA